MTQIEKKELEIYITKLEKENAEMRKISTRKGFYNEYFNELKNAKTNKEAFNTINKRFYSLFGKYRYSDFLTFKNMTGFYNVA